MSCGGSVRPEPVRRPFRLNLVDAQHPPPQLLSVLTWPLLLAYSFF